MRRLHAGTCHRAVAIFLLLGLALLACSSSEDPPVPPPPRLEGLYWPSESGEGAAPFAWVQFVGTDGYVLSKPNAGNDAHEEGTYAIDAARSEITLTPSTSQTATRLPFAILDARSVAASTVKVLAIVNPGGGLVSANKVVASNIQLVGHTFGLLGCGNGGFCSKVPCPTNNFISGSCVSGSGRTAVEFDGMCCGF